MSTPTDSTEVFFAFHGLELLHRGTLPDVARRFRHAEAEARPERLALYREKTGAAIDLDTSGSEAEVLGRLAVRFPFAFVPGSTQPLTGPAQDAVFTEGIEPALRGRGRPKLGVVSREVSLLPRHWDWLAEQRGGASATLRLLVERASKTETSDAKVRKVVNALYAFVVDLVGNQPHFEEAARALFGKNWSELRAQTEGWPKDVRAQIARYIEQAERFESS